MSASDVLKMIKDKEAEFVDLRFTDPRGKLQHLTIDSTVVDEDMLNQGNQIYQECLWTLLLLIIH